MPRSILQWVSKQQRKQAQKRKQIAHSKWTSRFNRKRAQKRKATFGTWNTRQLGAVQGYIDQET